MTDPGSHQPSTLGGSLGGKSARLVADAVTYAKAKMTPHQLKLATAVFTETTNHVSDEVRGVMGPFWTQLANDPETPDEFKSLFHALGTQRGQAWAWIGGSITSAVMAGGLMDVLTNMLRPVTLPIIRHNPTAPLDAGVAAGATVRAVMSDDAGYEDAASGGTNRRRFEVLKEMARTYPTIVDLREMMNRGEATLQQATDVLQRLGIPPAWSVRLLDLRKMPLTPEQLAAMWNRSIVSMDEGAAIAAHSGVSRKDFERLTELGGEPLSPQDLGEAYRRGFIDKARFNRGIVQGPIRAEWFDVLEKLQFTRMTPDAAADAVNQGHLSLAEGKQIAHEHGLVPEDFATIIDTAGSPPGLEFMEEAYNRGLISDAEWEVAFKESRIKNRYIPIMRKMRQRLIPTETARLMFREGVYTEDELIRTLKGHGYSDRDAQAQANLEVARRTEATKELSRGQLMSLYQEDLIDQAQLRGGLEALGYAGEELGWLTELAEVDKVRRFVNAAVSRVKSSYVANRIDASETANLLDEIGISPMQRDRLMSIWDIERDIISAQLTTAQITSAFKKGLIDAQGMYDRFRGRGYSPEDAAILVVLGGGDPGAITGN